QSELHTVEKLLDQERKRHDGSIFTVAMKGSARSSVVAQHDTQRAGAAAISRPAFPPRRGGGPRSSPARAPAARGGLLWPKLVSRLQCVTLVDTRKVGI